ncbi:MAG TPA: hemopexin repeat-containing protein, partial [Streptosporangiaceae bacterium]|nr:hemopexin repeat-containing protein [Streptosporangiaceae bacterium]
EPSPFDRGEVGLAEITLIRRAAMLALALGIGAGELFGVLVALEGDPALQRYSTFTVIGAPAAETRDLHRVLVGNAPDQALWLAQTLFAVTAWMREAGFDGAELAEILGGRPDAPGGTAGGTAGGAAGGAAGELFDRLQEDLDQVAFGPEALRSDRFGERAAQAVHDVLVAYDKGVVAALGSRLLDLDPDVVPAAAYHGVTDLSVVYSSDFAGFGLGDRLAEKIFRNLVYHGRLHADGTLAVASAEELTELTLSGDFADLRESLFKTIGATINGAAAFYPSDLDLYDALGEELRAELYDNLIFNGYLEDNGDLADPDFFLVPDNVAAFAVNVDLSDAEEPVAALIEERLAAFRDEPIAFSPDPLAGLRLTDAQLTRLVDSLRFNGYLDADGYFTGQAALAELTAPAFAVAAEFTRLRPAILAAIQGQIVAHRAELTTFTAADFAEPADELAAERVFAALDGDVLVDGRVIVEEDFADPEGTLDLGPGFSAADRAQAYTRIFRVLGDQAPYRVAPAALGDLGLTDAERDALLAHLVGSGDLTDRHCVAAARLGYFANADNSLDFALPGMEDFAHDVFFLLHDAAVELTAAVTEVTGTLTALADKQDKALYTCLADVLGLSDPAAQALCQSVAGGARQARLLLAGTALDDDTLPDDPRLPLALRRIRRFALLAAKLDLDPVEIRAVFLDQDLTGKYPEPLTLPPGVDRVEALLDSKDGTIYLFAQGGYWTYSGTTYAPLTQTRKPLEDLSPNLSALAGVDAAFVRPDGTEWLLGHDAAGDLATFVRQPGGRRWAPRAQTWGKIKNNFADPARVDSAFTDRSGRTYLFAGDQYVRYSGGIDVVDEGYPRTVAEWWEREGLDVAAGSRVDAGFQDPDGTVHLFSGTRWSTPGAAGEAAAVWGAVRPTFADLTSVDAAYAAPSAVHFLSGAEALRYSDSVENDGVLADEGVPRRLGGVPPRFESGVEAAFTDPSGVLHLFKDGQTAALDGTAVSEARTADRWGVLADPLPGGTVDAAFAGLDGRTYLFSGTTYLRYSTADYTTADSGYPRAIDADWGGLTRVDAAFVMDGRTYLFGTGGLLFDLPPSFEPDLDGGLATPRLRNLLRQHGFTLDGPPVAAPGTGAAAAPPGGAPATTQWSLATVEGGTLTVKREGLRLKVYSDDSRCYVRYSTHDYRTPDPGFPKPLSDNWWNLPDDMRLGPVDAVFTGRDDRTYLFAGDRFVRFDARHRWWSEPMPLADHWDSIPFGRVDAAFVGVDGRTYLFSGTRYVRYSTDDYTEIDDGYPADIAALWGRVANNLARTGKVDAALVFDVTETVDGVAVPRTRTYLFSGDQYVRYSGGYDVIDAGYPRAVSALATEPGLAALPGPLDGVDAAFSDRRTAYLIRGGLIHAVSTAQYRRYTDVPAVGCAFVEDGAIIAETSEGWVHLSALEGREVSATPFRPRALRAVPPRYQADLDAVLTGADGNSYLFQGESCFNVQLNADYPIAEEWGRPRNAIHETGAVDAAFVGLDGKTYLFSDDQFVVYPDATGLIDGDPQPIAAKWAGLTSVVLAYVHEDRTYLFERPAGDGTVRYTVYTGATYTAPADGYPATTGLDHFGAPDGFPFPDAVLVNGGTLILLSGEKCVSRDGRTGRWSVVRPIERLYPGFGRGLDQPDGLRTAFAAADGATYFFFDKTYAAFRDDDFGPLSPVKDHWGVSRNPFIAKGGTVDAAFVWRGQYTYLFSGDRYVRYTGRTYRYIDPGYPKPIAVELRKEPPFTKLPDTFEDDLLPGGKVHPIDAVVGNDRTIHILIGAACHTVSPEPAASLSLRTLGRIRNTLAATGKVDAAHVADRRIYLLSGDQYVRYSGPDRTYVDDGYPRPLADLAGPDELDLPPLPPDFQDGLDAILRGPDGTIYLFKGRTFRAGDAVSPIAGRWGLVRNSFDFDGPAAAFVAPSGELYVFSGDQYVRYAAASTLELVDPGYPRTVRDDWGDLPAAFEAGPDGAFVLDGRTYLLKDEEYVRYSSGLDAVDRTFPQSFAHRWSGTVDYRLTDVHTIVRFAELCRAHPDGLAAFFLDGADDPYAFLAETFGWELDEIRWARRNMALLRPDTSEEQLFEIEFLLALTGLFASAAKIGAGPSELYPDVWAKVHGPAPDLDAAATALFGMLERRTAPADWPVRSATIHNALNGLKRDALVAYLVPPHGSSRDLYERYLIDVDMGDDGTTTRVREAIAATQLYLQRYLLGLEEAALPAGVDPDEVKERLREWWTWMRNYRTWEANRKVFLFPENYLRPELRARKTLAFKALEDDLLQGEITADTVQAAYKRYLDEYTEVSRLTIAGGYVYAADGAAPGVRELVLFGRTRTEPRRYYYRTAQFRDRVGEPLSATWAPWHKVEAQITADRVAPVHAFGRVFAFWPVVEPVPQTESATTTITPTGSGGGQRVAATQPNYQVKIYYSFRNLNGEWASAQLLAADTEQKGQITEPGLYVQASRTVPGVSDHDSIVVQCTYMVGTTKVTSALILTPELYGLRATETIAPPKPADLSRLFLEPAATPITTDQVVRFNMPADSQDGPWYSVDHKGGSFLCRPIAAPSEPAPLQPFAGNTDRLPTTWSQVDAAVRLPDGTLYFFDSAGGKYIAAGPDKTTSRQTRQNTADRFGVIGTNLMRTGFVDAGLVRGRTVFLFSGDEYYRYSTFGTLDPGYPKKIEFNTENPPLPNWTKIDFAFTAPGGVEVFYSKDRAGFVVSGALGTVRPVSGDWQVKNGPDRIVVQDDKLFLVFGGQYIRLLADLTADKAPRDLAKNADGVPEQGSPGPVLRVGGLVVSFDNTKFTYTVRGPGVDETPLPNRELGRVPTEISRTGVVTAAYLVGTTLYLVGPDEYVRYTLADGAIPEYIDAGYPKAIPEPIDVEDADIADIADIVEDAEDAEDSPEPIRGVFQRGDLWYVFTRAGYAILPAGHELDTALTFTPYQGNWRGLPAGFAGDFTGMLTGDTALYFFLGADYAAYPTSEPVPRPYEITALPYDIIRLTSSTAYELNRRLLTGGVAALLDPTTQELDELPAVSTTNSDATTVRVGDQGVASVPVSSHLDFDSSNGLYYWELFCHAPLLIAQALTGAQRFDDARTWYEYVFDPTRPASYWRFLPFLAVDVAALAADCRATLAELKPGTLTTRLTPILTNVEEMAPAFRHARALSDEEIDDLDDYADAGLAPVWSALATQPQDHPAVKRLTERVSMIARLRRQYDLIGDREALLHAYLDDPFDPHAIAELRPEAFRRAVVMGYIDNLLDWGDMLFRRYTAESVDEARMLYIYAYDLLGPRPHTVGTAALPPAAPYELEEGEGPGETGHLTADGTLLENSGEVHAGIASPYFYVPGNDVLLEYWTRVEDRLTKIRASLDIMGISRPLPRFDPPADVMALVRGAAAGLSTEQVVAAMAAPLWPYRFDVVHQRAKDLADRVRQVGAQLLDAIERHDGERLLSMRHGHDAEILSLARQIKETQVKIAEEGLAEIRASRDAAQWRVNHYEKLIADGLSPLQEAQLSMLGIAAAAQFTAGGLKIAAAIASGLPQTHVGPFILGWSAGGDEIGDALTTGADVSSSFGEGFGMIGELLGAKADHERTEQDWEIQLATSRSEFDQLGHQVAAAELQVAVARRDLEIHLRQLAQADAVTDFLAQKFANAELFGWMAGQVSGLYFQTYQLAYEMARAAERAYESERGAVPGIIRPTYWDSRRKGLLAGDQLALDLDRLGQAYAASHTRGMEITKRVSLLRLDPLALLNLKNDGRCEFALTETLFDRDFPGHYLR